MEVRENVAKKGLDSLLDSANAAAKAAAEEQLALLTNAGPRWAVVEHENPLDNNSPIKDIQGTMLDLCGFAWIELSYKGNAKLINHIKKNGKANGGSFWEYRGFSLQKGTYQGFNLSVRIRRQEISIKEKAFGAAVAVLNEAGFDTYVKSRLD